MKANTRATVHRAAKKPIAWGPEANRILIAAGLPLLGNDGVIPGASSGYLTADPGGLLPFPAYLAGTNAIYPGSTIADRLTEGKSGKPLQETAMPPPDAMLEEEGISRGDCVYWEGAEPGLAHKRPPPQGGSRALAKMRKTRGR